MRMAPAAPAEKLRMAREGRRKSERRSQSVAGAGPAGWNTGGRGPERQNGVVGAIARRESSMRGVAAVAALAIGARGVPAVPAGGGGGAVEIGVDAEAGAGLCQEFGERRRRRTEKQRNRRCNWREVDADAAMCLDGGALLIGDDGAAVWPGWGVQSRETRGLATWERTKPFPRPTSCTCSCALVTDA
jgi:hypothetical protein